MIKQLTLIAIIVMYSIHLNAQTGYEFPNASNTAKTNRTSATLAQKDVEMITGAYQYSLDGKYLKGLDLSYIDFAKGAFRGTLFENVNLRFAIGVKKVLSNTDNDFTHTWFEGTTKLSYCRFTNWRMQNCQFTGTAIDSSLFTNSIMENCTFNGGSFKNSTVTHTTASFWNNCIFQAGTSWDGLRLTNVNLLNQRSATSTITNSIVTGSYINNWSFSGTPVTGIGRLENVSFNNDSILNMSFQYYKMVGRDSTNLLCSFNNCALTNFRFQNGEVGALFNDVRWKLGLVTSTHFLKSIFNNVSIIGGLGPSLRITFNTCNFSRCSFPGPVNFTNCDFTLCTWPAGAKPANVTFTGCTGSIWQ